ncbi:MAG: hypothetical protein V4460_14695 [Pseudomonadota bacterium]|jgi:hypothetical protein
MHAKAIACEVRYQLDPDQRAAFEDYGRAWVRLIERHGGFHYGFFLPRAAPGDSTLSFPGKGHARPGDVAIALYGFPDEATYNAYRRNVPLDPEAAPILERFVEPPFHSYERIFVSPLSPDA